MNTLGRLYVAGMLLILAVGVSETTHYTTNRPAVVQVQTGQPAKQNRNESKSDCAFLPYTLGTTPSIEQQIGPFSRTPNPPIVYQDPFCRSVLVSPISRISPYTPEFGAVELVFSNDMLLVFVTKSVSALIPNSKGFDIGLSMGKQRILVDIWFLLPLHKDQIAPPPPEQLHVADVSLRGRQFPLGFNGPVPSG